MAKIVSSGNQVIGKGPSTEFIRGGFICYGCRLEFETFEDQRSHYGTEWHSQNVRRRAVGMDPLNEQDFEIRKAEKLAEEGRQSGSRKIKEKIPCDLCGRQFSSQKAYDQHCQSKKHLAKAERADTSQQDDADAGLAAGEDVVESSGDVEDSSSVEVDEVKENSCLFCERNFDSLENCISHMSKDHSFFIPFTDHLVDMEGLLGALAFKVFDLHVCVKCNRRFRSLEAVQKHMIDSFHIKLGTSTPEEIELLGSFYDFGQESDESEGEDEDEDEDVGAAGGKAQAEEYEHAPPEVYTLSLGAAGSGSSGGTVRSIGSRELSRYYRQRFRPQETRPEVLLNQLVKRFEYRGGAMISRTQKRDEKFESFRRSFVAMKVGIRGNKVNQHYFRLQNPK